MYVYSPHSRLYIKYQFTSNTYTYGEHKHIKLEETSFLKSSVSLHNGGGTVRERSATVGEAAEGLAMITSATLLMAHYY